MNLASESPDRRRMADYPVTYLIFDLLYLDGRSLVDLPYTERRERLDALQLEGPSWQTPSHHRGEGKALLAPHRGARPRGAGRQAARQPLPARAAQPRLAEGEEHPQPGARDRRLAPRAGEPGGDDRRHPRRLPRGRRRSGDGCATPAGSAAASPRPSCGASPSCSSPSRRRRAPSRAASLPSRPSSSSPAWWPRSPSASGRRPEPCAPPCTRGCEPTRTRRRSSWNRRSRHPRPLRREWAGEGLGQGGLRGAGDDRARGRQRGAPGGGRADRRRPGDPAAFPRPHPHRAAVRRARPGPSRGGRRLLARPAARRAHPGRDHQRARWPPGERPGRAARAAQLPRRREAAYGRSGSRWAPTCARSSTR